MKITDKLMENGNELAQRRQDEIIHAARKIFAENGYRRTRIDEIADYLEVGKGTIYRYFANKKELFLETFKRSMDELSGIMADHVERESDPRKRIEAGIRTFLEYFDSHGDLVELHMQARGEFRDEHQKVVLQVYRGYMDMLQADLEEGMRRGLFRKMRVDETAEAVSAAMRGVVFGYYVRGGGGKESEERPLAEKASAVVELVMSGLLSRGNEC